MRLARGSFAGSPARSFPLPSHRLSVRSAHCTALFPSPTQFTLTVLADHWFRLFDYNGPAGAAPTRDEIAAGELVCLSSESAEALSCLIKGGGGRGVMEGEGRGCYNALIIMLLGSCGTGPPPSRPATVPLVGPPRGRAPRRPRKPSAERVQSVPTAGRRTRASLHSNSQAGGSSHTEPRKEQCGLISPAHRVPPTHHPTAASLCPFPFPPARPAAGFPALDASSHERLTRCLMRLGFSERIPCELAGACDPPPSSPPPSPPQPPPLSPLLPHAGISPASTAFHARGRGGDGGLGGAVFDSPLSPGTLHPRRAGPLPSPADAPKATDGVGDAPAAGRGRRATAWPGLQTAHTAAESEGIPTPATEPPGTVCSQAATRHCLVIRPPHALLSLPSPLVRYETGSHLANVVLTEQGHPRSPPPFPAALPPPGLAAPFVHSQSLSFYDRPPPTPNVASSTQAAAAAAPAAIPPAGRHPRPLSAAHTLAVIPPARDPALPSPPLPPAAAPSSGVRSPAAAPPSLAAQAAAATKACDSLLAQRLGSGTSGAASTATTTGTPAATAHAPTTAAQSAPVSPETPAPVPGAPASSSMGPPSVGPANTVAAPAGATGGRRFSLSPPFLPLSPLPLLVASAAAAAAAAAATSSFASLFLSATPRSEDGGGGDAGRHSRKTLARAAGSEDAASPGGESADGDEDAGAGNDSGFGGGNWTPVFGLESPRDFVTAATSFSAPASARDTGEGDGGDNAHASGYEECSGGVSSSVMPATSAVPAPEPISPAAQSVVAAATVVTDIGSSHSAASLPLPPSPPRPTCPSPPSSRPVPTATCVRLEQAGARASDTAEHGAPTVMGSPTLIAVCGAGHRHGPNGTASTGLCSVVNRHGLLLPESSGGGGAGSGSDDEAGSPSVERQGPHTPFPLVPPLVLSGGSVRAAGREPGSVEQRAPSPGEA